MVVVISGSGSGYICSVNHREIARVDQPSFMLTALESCVIGVISLYLNDPEFVSSDLCREQAAASLAHEDHVLNVVRTVIRL